MLTAACMIDSNLLKAIGCGLASIFILRFLVYMHFDIYHKKITGKRPIKMKIYLLYILEGTLALGSFMMLMDGISILTGDHHYVLCGSNMFVIIISILTGVFHKKES